MDSSETLAKEYLRFLGYTDIIYEPDGNIPPDFLVNGRIAVEVRRLNQNLLSYFRQLTLSEQSLKCASIEA